MKIIRYILILAVVGLGAFWLYQMKPREVPEPKVKEIIKNIPTKPDPQNMTYDVEGDTFVVKNGYGENPIPDSLTKSTLNVFDSMYGDLDGDGDTDAAVWLVNDPGGTGRFFYGAFIINNNGVSKATNSIFLGDRIAPQNINIKDGRAVYNFSERGPNDPMSADPSIGASIWAYYDKNTNEMKEWVKNSDTN